MAMGVSIVAQKTPGDGKRLMKVGNEGQEMIKRGMYEYHRAISTGTLEDAKGSQAGTNMEQKAKMKQ